MREKIEAVLFDLDGTLMDTDDQAVERLARRLRRLRWPRPHQAARRFVMASETPGNALITLLDMLGLDGPLAAFNGWLRRWRGQHTHGDFPLVADAKEMLSALNGRYRLAVVTTRGLAEAEAFLDGHDLHSVFEALVTRESTWRLKPHPAPIQHAAHLLGIPVERCAMVGDTTVDVRAARRAGAWAIGVLCGFGEREELERAGAHVILEHTAHVLSLLE
jgi:phosphoglycolate phosphatase-like HAD superfamily hydrolase